MRLLPLFLLTACENGLFGSNDFGITARFQDEGESRRAPAPIEALYYGELEIVAYDYRPGEDIQTGERWGRPGVGQGMTTEGDWSYVVPLQSGHEAARDNVLVAGGVLDFDDLSAGYSLTPERDFIDAVGAFDIDILEVQFNRTGVVHSGVYYGMNAEGNGLDVHPLHKYPALDGIEDHFTMPGFPGWEGEHQWDQNLSIFFARDDWFPEPLLVLVSSRATLGEVYEVEWTSLPESESLTAQQEEVLTSLPNNGTQRRGYSRFVIVPVPRVRIVFDPATWTTTDAVPLELDAALADVTVSYDLSQSLDDTSDFTLDDDGPNVMFSGDEDHIPFGVGVAFGERAP